MLWCSASLAFCEVGKYVMFLNILFKIKTLNKQDFSSNLAFLSVISSSRTSFHQFQLTYKQDLLLPSFWYPQFSNLQDHDRPIRSLESIESQRIFHGRNKNGKRRTVGRSSDYVRFCRRKICHQGDPHPHPAGWSERWRYSRPKIIFDLLVRVRSCQKHNTIAEVMSVHVFVHPLIVFCVSTPHQL